MINLTSFPNINSNLLIHFIPVFVQVSVHYMQNFRFNCQSYNVIVEKTVI